MGTFRVAWVGGRPAPIAGAKELGVDVVLVHEPGKYEPDILEHCERVVHAPIADGPAIVAALAPLHAERPFERVITTSEPAGVATGHAADALGLPGVSERVARTLKDKSLTRAALARAGVSRVRHATVASVADVEEFRAAVGGPVVVKPVDGAASRHIHRVDSAADAAAAWAALRSTGASTALAEEFLAGPVVSVESFSAAGRHLPVSCSQYRVNERYVEWEVSVPGAVAQRWWPELRDLTARVLDAVGLTEGPSHTEFVLTADGPRVLESHARLGGHALPELVRRAYGVDLARMMLTVPLGIEELPAAPPAARAGAAIRFFTPPPGVVAALDIDPAIADRVLVVPPEADSDVYLPLLAEVARLDAGAVVAKRVGSRIPELATLADCSSGYVLATGSDAADALAICDRFSAGVRFVVVDQAPEPIGAAR